MHKRNLLPAALAGGVLLALGAGVLDSRAQPVALHPAYYVTEFELRDPEGIRPYSAGVTATFAPFGGRFIARGGRIVGLEGTPPGSRTVVIEFPSMEQAQAWYDSPAYREIRPIRQRSGVSRSYIIDGVAP